MNSEMTTRMDTCKIFVSVTDEEDKFANLGGGYRVEQT
jgi:hypothetical protein